jgi:prepilin-type N-terminal cleavage/methylation domain-containing protein
MKKIRAYFGFTITELILAIAISSILVLTMGVVMVDTQRGWMDSYAKVHGGAATDAAVAKTPMRRSPKQHSTKWFVKHPDPFIILTRSMILRSIIMTTG